jgi:hypothetical protein
VVIISTVVTTSLNKETFKDPAMHFAKFFNRNIHIDKGRRQWSRYYYKSLSYFIVLVRT